MRKSPVYYVDDINNYIYAVYKNEYYHWSEYFKQWSVQPMPNAITFFSTYHTYRPVSLCDVKSIYPNIKSHKRVATPA